MALSLGPIDQVPRFEADGATVTFSGPQNEATGFYAADMWQRTTLGLPGEANLAARIATVNQARIDGDTVNAQAITNLTARTANTEADIIDLENAQANEALARAQAIQQVSASALSGEGVLLDACFQIWPASSPRPDNVAAPPGLTISRQGAGSVYGDKAMRLADPGTGNAFVPILATGFAPASDNLHWVVEYVRRSARTAGPDVPDRAGPVSGGAPRPPHHDTAGSPRRR